MIGLTKRRAGGRSGATVSHAGRRGLLAATLLFSGGAAFAQELASVAPLPESDSNTVEEIVVTARRRDENAQSVPVAITAFGGETLEARRTYNVRDLQQLTPSLAVTVTNPRNTSINIRGVGNNVSVFNDGLQPAVGVYLDQVYLGRPAQAVFDLSDVQSVQVLRGPQGTLFGKNTSAGALVIATKEPTFNRELFGDFSYGNYDYTQFHLTAGGPLRGETVAGRLTVSHTQRNGFNTNILDGSDTQDFHDFGGKAQLLFLPNDDIRLRLIGDYSQQYSETAANVLVGLFTNYADDGSVYPNGFLARAARVGFVPPPFDPEARLVSVNTKNYYHTYTGGLAGIGDWDVGPGTLTAVTAYRFWNWYPRNDADSTTAPAQLDGHQDNEQQQFSQELRFASPGERTVDYVAGLYYFWQKIEAQAIANFGPLAADWLLAPAAGSAAARSAALNNYLVVGDSEPITESAAAFAQGSWHATDKLELTLGLRYTWEKISGFFDQKAYGQDLSGLSPADRAAALAIRARFGVANRFEPSTEDGQVTGQFTASYQATDDVLAYATYARGYKAGGINLSNINTTGSNGVDPVVGPEIIDSYEAGLKTRFFDRRLVANLALFWTEDDNYQTTRVNLDNGISSLTNAGKVRSRGVELDLQAAPVEGLSVYASTTFNDASYTEYEQAPCPIEIRLTPVCDLSDRRLPGPSKWAVSAGGEYARPAGQFRGETVEAYVGGDYSYRSSFFTTPSNSIYSRIPEYDVVNLRVGLRFGDGRYDVQVFGRNVFDELYYLTLSASNTGGVYGTLGDPRTYGVTLRARY